MGSNPNDPYFCLSFQKEEVSEMAKGWKVGDKVMFRTDDIMDGTTWPGHTVGGTITELVRSWAGIEASDLAGPVRVRRKDLTSYPIAS